MTTGPTFKCYCKNLVAKRIGQPPGRNMKKYEETTRGWDYKVEQQKHAAGVARSFRGS